MNSKKFKEYALLATFMLIMQMSFAQNYNIQQNQQNVNINVPVIEKTVYVDRYRTVYIERRAPFRLKEPMLLHGYLLVYTEDIGDFKSQTEAQSIICNINNACQYDHDTWRIPTPAELRVLEANADKIGLGDGIYLATDHANGILRLVSTGVSVSKRKEQEEKAAQIAEEKRQRELEREREREREYERKMKERQQQAELARQRQEQEKAKALAEWSKKNPQEAIKQRTGLEILVTYGGWEKKHEWPNGYRLATSQDIQTILKTFANNKEVLIALFKSDKLIVTNNSYRSQSYYYENSWTLSNGASRRYPEHGRHCWITVWKELYSRNSDYPREYKRIDGYKSKQLAISSGENDAAHYELFYYVWVKK